VSAQDSNVFLCYNGEGKPAVREIAQKLVEEGIRSWLAQEQIRSGTLRQTELEQQLRNIKYAAFLWVRVVLDPGKIWKSRLRPGGRNGRVLPGADTDCQYTTR
jgi:hypothetical protein